MKSNPFSYKTPEQLKPEEVAALFVEVFLDFERLREKEHTFIHGARGTGKSMMFRYLEPFVQIHIKEHGYSKIADIPYFAVHIPIKSGMYSLSELERLDGTSYWAIAEHFLISNITINIFTSINKIINECDANTLFVDELSIFIKGIRQLIINSGVSLISFPDSINSIDSLYNFFKIENSKTKRYLSEISFRKESIPFTNFLLSYDDFLLPFIQSIRTLSFTPAGPLFLMLDDADNLSKKMQSILNTWISYRTNNDLCIKVSTQKRYQTWRTISGLLIESPHDFHEIDISSIYTSNHFSDYRRKLRAIVEKRLILAGINNVNPEEFFPENKEQNLLKDKIKEELLEKWEHKESRAKRSYDDQYRYSSSEVMKYLAKKKHSHHYSYAGFNNLVNLSSGMIRNFLELAGRMYSQEFLEKKEVVFCVHTAIQDRIIYKWSEDYFLEEFERVKVDQCNIDDQIFNKLRNLINALGTLFQKKLVSDDSERRFISFSTKVDLSSDLEAVLNLGIDWGYFSYKTIGRKEGAGRNKLYTLNRRLAPYFKLDPSGYAAHMSIKESDLILATEKPDDFVNLRMKSLSSQTQESLPLFD